MDEINALRYFWHLFGIFRDHQVVADQLVVGSGCIKRAFLKFDQKLNIIRERIIPKVLYDLQNIKVDDLAL